MNFKCCKCNKLIFLNTCKYSGKQYCLPCYNSLIASIRQANQDAQVTPIVQNPTITSPNSDSTSWLIKNHKLFASDKNCCLSIDKDTNTYIFTISRRNQILFTIPLHKLFTYTYGNSNYRVEVVINVADGEPFLVTFGYDGGADGDGEYYSFSKISFDSLRSIIAKKNTRIQELFKDFSHDTWKNYLTVSYQEPIQSNAVYYIAAVFDSLTHIAVSFQSNPTHRVTYIECPTEAYFAWKSNHKDFFDCICHYHSLSSVATTYLSASHSPFKSKQYSYSPVPKPTPGGALDLAIVFHNTTEFYTGEAVHTDNALAFIHLVENTCRAKAPKNR